MTESRWTCVLWDVDGTLVDASEGILKRLIEAHEHFGRTPPKRADLIHWIGPPMYDSFRDQLGMTSEEATEAVTFYRSLNKRDGFSAGAKLFPGVADIVAALHDAGVPQATASSKPEPQVIGLMEHFGLDTYLTAMVGSTPDERTLANKADIVREALRRLAAAGVDTSRPVLIGDRHHDVIGGTAAGVPVIFVTWGFSAPEEAEGAMAVARTMGELRALLLDE